MNTKSRTSISLRTKLIAGMLTLAIVGFSMVIVTGYIYRDLAYQNQRNAITELIGLKITNILDELSEISKVFGMEVQSNPDLRSAIKQRNIENIKKVLDQQYKRYFVTAGMLKLKDIYIFDESFEFITNSSAVKLERGIESLSCSNMTSIAKKRVGSQRLKPMSQLCTKNYESLYGVIVPVGTLRPFAFMLLVSDPAHNVIQLEGTLGDPIKIQRYSDDVVYQSPAWPTNDNLDEYLISHHVLRAPNGTTLLKTHAARDIEPYRKQLAEYTIVIILISIAIFTLVLGVVIFTIRKSLKPLDELQSAAKELSKGKHIKVQRTIVPEIDVVIQSYNKMSEEITSLIRKLKSEILGHKKTESTLKQHQHDLSLARDQAFAASRAKSAFLANMSHELRTPLNAIIGYADMLYEDANDNANQQQITDLEKIIASGQHLLSIIDNILDLSKIESGEISIKPTETNFEKFIRDINITMTPIAEINHNKLNLQCEETIGTIYTDVSKLRQCLLNILDNACKFTQHGSVTLNVKTEKKNEQDWLRFTISDTGIGFGEEQARNIFSEFTQVDSSTTKHYAGAGLGLALSKRFCELVGGHISFESEEGKGSTFIISVPRKVKESISFEDNDKNHGDNSFSRSA